MAAFALIWVMARQLVGPVGALVAVLIIDGLHYFTFTAPKFNHDVIQLPFWALAGYAYWAALRHGRMVHWLLLGFGIGMARLGEVFRRGAGRAAGAVRLIDRDARKALLTPGPYIAVGVALAGDGAASGLAGAERLPAVRLCRCARACSSTGRSTT